METLKQEYDRLLNERSKKQAPIGKINGSCQSFCPYFEMVERRLRNDVSRFEKDFMIKKYVRSAAGRNKALEEDVRPLPVLCSCFDYLMDVLEGCCKAMENAMRPAGADESANLAISTPNSTDDKDLDIDGVPSLFEVYKFVEDRTRAIRLDISVQELSCGRTVVLLQQICNFHIVFNCLLYDDEKFEEHLNADQIRRVLLSLMECYKLRRSVPMTLDQQRYYSYNVMLRISSDTACYGDELFSTDDKIVNNSTHSQYEVINDAFDLLSAVQRGNTSRFFKFMKHADFLTRCLLTTQLRYVRQAAMDMFKMCFYEKIDCSLVMSWLHITDRTYFEGEGVKIEDDKLCFRERPFVPREVHARLLPAYAVYPLQNIANAIKYDVYEVFVRKMVLHEYTRLLIENFMTRKKVQYQSQPGISADINQVMIFIYRKYAYHLSIKMVLNNIYIQRMDLIVKWQQKAKKKRNKRKLLLVVLEKTVSAAMFRQRVKNSPLKPSFIDYRPDLNVEEMLPYKMVLFVTAKKHHEQIKNTFYMLNKVVCLPNSPAINLEQIVESANYIVKRKLSTMIDVSQKEKTMAVMCSLIENKRNPQLKDVMIKFERRGILDDIDVYYEDKDGTNNV
ncbi:Nuclear protein export factor [Trachipleistophora hominis]|uniref:Nuclear protein export factor n=1 Tax=Trachipleistophora hominis TaxID=72359 RepID=L7JZH1_TRAHO|nr:Nuclear protein export factor [Trachipleistophora hominis]